MPEIVADPLSLLLSKPGIEESQSLGPDPFPPHARDARGRFAKGSSGNPRGRPRGIRNPRRRVPDLVARPLSAQVLSNLLDRKPHLLRPLVLQLLPPPLAAIDPAERLGIDLSSRRGFPAAAAHRSGGHRARRDYALRGRAHRAAGAYPVARDPAPGARRGGSNPPSSHEDRWPVALRSTRPMLLIACDRHRRRRHFDIMMSSL
jgi:Family of unknown function (DUF5681)